jgi:molybdate transport system ATP-binding protein
MHLIPPLQRYIKLDQVVELLGIENLLYRRPAKLSGGEKQRVAIGRALLTSPAILLMDEPLASLDEIRKAEVLPFISALTSSFSVPILYVTHDLEEIMTLADNVVLIESGRVIAAGSPEEVIGSIELQYPKISILKSVS